MTGQGGWRDGIPWVVALATTAGYALSCTPVFAFHDTAELAAAGFALGVTHPPGQPTYAVLGKLVALLPLGAVGFRAALLSALGAGATVLCAGGLARAFAVLTGEPRLGRVAAASSCVALAASGPLANQATRPEVYAVAAPLFAGAVLLAARGLTARSPTRDLAAAGLTAGLAATLHPAAGLAAATVCVLAVLLGRPAALRSSRVWSWTMACGLAGLVPFALVALRCRPSVPCWEDPMTARAFFDYVVAAPYAGNAPQGLARWQTLGAALLFLLSATGFAAASALVLAVLAELFGRARGAGGARRLVACAGMAGAVLSCLWFVATQPFFADNPDTQGTLLPSLVLLVAAGPVAAGLLGGRIRAAPSLAATSAVLLVAAVTTLGGEALGFRRDRSWLGVALADEALGEARPAALVLTSSDALYFAMRYAQVVEGARPDVGVMALGLAGRRSHWRSVARVRPELDLSRAEVAHPRASHWAWGAAALRVTEGLVPRYAESGRALPLGARATGVLYALDAGRLADAPLPRTLHRAEGGQDVDAAQRVLRALRIDRATALEARGGIREALVELAAGPPAEPHLRRLAASLRVGAPLRPRLSTPPRELGWRAEREALRATAARLLYRAGRTRDAVDILERDLEAGHLANALPLGELLLREGLPAEAARRFRALRRARPEDAPWADVGLALVQAARGDPDGARRAVRRIARGAPPDLGQWCSVAEREVLPALIRDPRRLRRPSGS